MWLEERASGGHMAPGASEWRTGDQFWGKWDSNSIVMGNEGRIKFLGREMGDYKKKKAKYNLIE